MDTEEKEEDMQPKKMKPMENQQNGIKKSGQKEDTMKKASMRTATTRMKRSIRPRGAIYDEATEFDNDAVYYQGTTEPNDPMAEAELYDEAYASYIDARKRFNDIKLSRGYLPIVALTDAGLALQPGVCSSTRSPTSSPHGRKGKGGKSKPSGKGKNKVRYPPCGAGKAPDPKVLRCNPARMTGTNREVYHRYLFWSV